MLSVNWKQELAELIRKQKENPDYYRFKHLEFVWEHGFIGKISFLEFYKKHRRIKQT